MSGPPDPLDTQLEAVVAHLAPRRDDETPPFEQVRRGLAAAAADGTLPPGTRLPPVRALAERLGLAAGTVARVYRELESDGVVRTEGRRGTFVGGVAADDREAAGAAAAYAVTARRRGLGLVEAQRLLEEHWTPR